MASPVLSRLCSPQGASASASCTLSFRRALFRSLSLQQRAPCRASPARVHLPRVKCHTAATPEYRRPQLGKVVANFSRADFLLLTAPCALGPAGVRSFCACSHQCARGDGSRVVCVFLFPVLQHRGWPSHIVLPSLWPGLQARRLARRGRHHPPARLPACAAVPIIWPIRRLFRLVT